MKLDLPVSEKWEQLNEKVQSCLQIQSTRQVRVYKDLSSAVLEIAQGTAQFLTHKKHLAFIKGQSPAYDFLLPHFYKEAFQIKHVSYLQLPDIKEWAASLPMDTCFVIYAEDHPVTGEKYSFCDELDRLLNERRIHSLRISHARFHHEDLEVRPYSVRLCSWAEDLTVAVCGERFRSPPMAVHRQNWEEAAVVRQLETLKVPAAISATAVQNFEQELHRQEAGIRPLLNSQQERLWDRAVLEFSGISGEALVSLLSSRRPELASQIETTNMCRWQSTRLYTWWEPVISDETLRGIVIFDAKILDSKDLVDLVLSTYREIQQLQTW